MNEDIRSKNIVLIPFCMICQAFQASGIVKKWDSIIEELYDYLKTKHYNLIQMPCGEAFFKSYTSIKRDKHGLKYYDTKEYREHCKLLAEQTFNMIKNIISSGYNIPFILGIENSPTCSINYIYTNKGNIKRKGIFIEELYNLLIESKINIPLIPIYRKNIDKTIRMIEELTK